MSFSISCFCFSMSLNLDASVRFSEEALVSLRGVRSLDR